MARSFRQRLRDLAIERAGRLAQSLVGRTGRSATAVVVLERPRTPHERATTSAPTAVVPVTRQVPVAAPAPVETRGRTTLRAPAQVSPDTAEPGTKQKGEARDDVDQTLVLARHLHLQLRRRGAPVFGPSPFAADGRDHDAASVRAMRIGSRRLRAFVEVCAPWLPAKTTRRLRRDLRAITRALGPLREYDVLAGSLQALLDQAAEPTDAIALEHMLESITPQRQRLRKRAAKAIARVDRSALDRDFRKATSRVLTRLIQDDEPPQFTAWSLFAPRVEWAFRPAIPDSLDDLEAVHETRIRCKRLRYALELLEPAFEDDKRTVRRALKRTQAAIGEARDARHIADVVAAEHDALVKRGRVALADALLGLRQRLESDAIARESTVVPALTQLGRADVTGRGRGVLAPAVTYRYPLPSQVGQ